MAPTPKTLHMKNVDDLIESAGELASRGLSRGEIADELNVSRETASWLVDQSSDSMPEESRPASGPQDIHVDWSVLGRDSTRLSYVGKAMADLLSKHSEDVDLVIGIEKAGAPLATTVARELDTDLGTYAPAKHRWEEGDLDEEGGSFSRNFASIRGRECYVVDDTITSGRTMTETIRAVRESGGTPVAGSVLVDKGGAAEIDGIPIHSLVGVVPVKRADEE
jgi:orotate phosphoribosyltransferase